MSLARSLALVTGVAAALGCSSPDTATPTPPSDPWDQLPEVTHLEPELASLPRRAEALRSLCARGRGDPFARALCSGTRPELASLESLLAVSGLGEDRAFALTANSTSLVVKSVSALNPRVLVFPKVGPDLTRPSSLTAIGFVRGEQFVELASRDDTTGDLNFYLLVFEQRCSYDSAGCSLASLLTEDIERDWTAYSVYDHDDLEGTSFDCLSCHRPGGVGTKRILRMQELSSPWLHWFPQRFVQRTDSDRVLTQQFVSAHQHEARYGGIPISTISGTLDEGSGAQLEALIRAEGFAEQPNPFDGKIARELSAGESPTWQARYDAHLRGEAIAVPYPLVDTSDAAKREAASRSYQDVVQGVAPRESLLDTRDLFSQDAQLKLSLLPKPGADGKTVLLQMCARCHDGRSNPQLGKSRFNVLALETMSPAEKTLAIARMNANGAERMPPWRTGSLTAEALAAATAELQR